ncbi:hypothetical protein HDU85_002951 [Gaertneriomyces sp. JEL0708]|nr:hypothetical protein HDU85_002951 [Gaertneriomyces sp. JEL0708]
MSSVLKRTAAGVELGIFDRLDESMMRTPKTPGSVFSPNIWLGHNTDPRRQSFGTNILRLNIHFCVTRDPTFDPVTYTPRDQLIHEYQFLQRVVNPDTVTVSQLKELVLQTWEKVEKESGKRHRVRADRIKQLDIRNADNSTIPTDLTVVDAFDDRERLHVLALVEPSATVDDIFDSTHLEDTSFAGISSDNITFEHINDIGNSNDKKRRRSFMEVDDENESDQANGAGADLKAISNSKVAHAIKRRRHEENATEEDDDTSFLRDESYLQENQQLLSPLLLPEDVHRMTLTSTLDGTTSSQVLKSTGALLPTGNIVDGLNSAVTDGISEDSASDSEDEQKSDAASNATQEGDDSSGSEDERADEAAEITEDASATATRPEQDGVDVDGAQSDTSEDSDDEGDDEPGGTPLESETTRPAKSTAAINMKEPVSAPSPSESEAESESDAIESESESKSNSEPETETPEQAATDSNTTPTKPLNTTPMHHHKDSESEEEDDSEDQSDGHLAQVSPPATDRTPALSNVESGEDSDDGNTEDNSDEESDVEEDGESTAAESDDVTSTSNNVSSETDDRASVRVQELAAASTAASAVQSKQAVAMMSPPDSPLGRNKTQSNAVKPAIESSRRQNKSASRVTATPVTESPQHSEAERSDDDQASPNLLSQSSPPFKFQSQSKTSSQPHKSSASFDSLSGLTQAATAGNPLSAAMRLSAAQRSRNWSSLSELSANPSEFSFSQSQVSQQLLPVDSDTHGEDSDEEDEEDEEPERSDSSGDSDSSDDEDSDTNGHPVRLAGKKRRKRKSAFLDLAADVERPVKRAQARQASVPLSQQSQTTSNARLFFSQPLPSTAAKSGKSAKVVRKPLLSQTPHQRRISKPISTEALRRSAKETRETRTREELARELDGEESD